jgi:mono/diheme cytochrome c family protein
MRKVFGLTLAVAFVMTTAAAVRPQDKGTGAASVEGGRELFTAYCASCHGASGRGDGPAADSFKVPPSNLTQLAKRNGGVFVADRIHRTIDGRGAKAHGSGDMPVWGDVFRRRQGLEDETVKARIDAIIGYLKAIQERSS